MGILSCEQEFVPEVSTLEPEIVVEGYVEAGPQTAPAYVILTRSLPFFSAIGPDQIDANFIHDALVTVHDGDKSVTFQEVCLDEIPPEFQDILLQQFGIDPDSFGINFCLYIDLFDQLIREQGRTYNLNIEAEGKTITSSTTIPLRVGLDSLFFSPPPDPGNDTMAQLTALITDPPGVGNYYRYFMQRNGGPFISDFSALTDDAYFDGKTFDFELLRPETVEEDADFNTYGLYFLGDTMTIKWCNIDKEHFAFWNTLEFSQANQGPFANYVRIDSNIEGGLGIWGGYTVSIYQIVVEY